MNIIDQDGYELVKRNLKIGHRAAAAAEAEGFGDSVPKELSKTGESTPRELSKNKFSGEGCSKELRHRWGCKERDRSCAGVVSRGRETGSVGRLIKKGRSQ